MKTIAVVNLKGGVGKSMIVQALAVQMVLDGLKTAICDRDPQQSTGAWWARRERSDDLTLYDTRTAAQAVAKARGAGCDWLVMDTAPAFVKETELNVAQADVVLIPVRPSPEDVLASADAIKICRDLEKQHLVVLNELIGVEKMHVTARRDLRRHKVPVAGSMIRHRLPHATAGQEGKAASELSGPTAAKAAADITKLLGEICNLVRRETRR